MSAPEEAGSPEGAGRRAARYAGVLAGVVLSGCSSLVAPSRPLNEDPSGLDGDRLPGRSTWSLDADTTPTPTDTPTATETPTPTPGEEPATTPTETARPADAQRDREGGSTTRRSSSGSGGSGSSSGGSSYGYGGGGGSSGGYGGGGGSAGGSSGGGSSGTPTPTATATPVATATPTATPTTTPTPTDTPTRAVRTPIDILAPGTASTPRSHTVTVSDRETGYLCLLDVDAPVSLSFSGEAVDGGRVNWYLCDPTRLDSYWGGSDQAVFASFTDWATFGFGPFTTGAGPTALVVEPVDGPVTLSYSVSVA